MTTSYADKPLRTWEITWNTGRIDRVRGHQISWPGAACSGEPHAHIYGEIDGQWRLVLDVAPQAYLSMREVPAGERWWWAKLWRPRIKAAASSPETGDVA